MPVINDEQQRDALSDEHNPGQAHYDDAFASITAPKNYKKNGNNTKSPNQSSSSETDTAGGLKGAGKRVAGRYAGAKNSLRGKVGSLLKNKWAVGGLVGGSGIAMLIVVLILLLGAFKIPHLMENISKYQFARVLQQSARENDRIVSSKIAVDSADETTKGKYKAKYDEAAGKVQEKWQKLDKYQPNKVIANLRTDDAMRFHYQGSRLVGITINNQTTLVPKSTFGKKLIPGYTFTNNANVAGEFAPELKVALRANDVGMIVRGRVASQLRKELGISLIAWKVGEFKGTTPEKARLIAERISYTKTNTVPSDAPVSSPLKSVASDAEAASNAGVKDDSALKAALKNNGVFKSVSDTLSNGVKTDAFQTGLSWVNPVYAIATPICIVYDGSISSSGSTINAQSKSQISAYNLLASAADQEKNGTDSDAKAVGAFNAKVGNINDSTPMKRANGQVADTSGSPSPQAGAGGDFTLFNATFGGDSGLASTANTFADRICPVLTNTGLAFGVALANGAVILASGGSAGAAEEVAAQATTKTATSIVRRSVEKYIGKKTVNTSIKAGKIIGDSAKTGAKIAAITVLAKQVVAAKAGQYNTGLEQGNDYVNEVDSGANLNSQEISRRQQYGIPLGKQSAMAAFGQTKQYVADQDRSQSAYQRYLAISNPSSLLTQFGTSLSTMNVKSIGSMINPIHLISSMASDIGLSKHAAAADEPTDLSYGNIQWGWTKQENDLLASEDYQMLENQRILDASGNEDQIANKYGKCFTEDIGTLLQDGDIKRDEDGNVINSDDALCSPQYLSYDNAEFGSQMVFRWRVAQADGAALDDQLDKQEVTAVGQSDLNTGAGTQFSIATFNFKGASHGGNPTGRLVQSVNTLKDNNIDVAGLQELQGSQRSGLLDKAGSTYSIYPNPASYGGHQSEDSIIWDKTKFTLDAKGSGIMPNLKYFNGQELKAPYVKLKAISGGQEFYVLNTHDPASISGTGSNSVYRYDNAKQHVAFIKTLQASGLPVFLTGDFNSGYCTHCSGPNIAYLNKDSNLTYCILTQDGSMNDGYDLSVKRSAKCPNPKPSKDNAGDTGGVDHIFMSKGVTLQTYKKVPPGGNGSDHPTLVMGVTIPGDGSGDSAGATGWQWPLSQNDWNGPFGYNVWGSCRVKCRHAGIDLAGTGGDSVLAAHTGTVQSVKYVTISGGTCKWQVVVKAGGTPYYYAYQHMGSVAVKSGQALKAGDKVGTVDTIGPTGSCGNGAHLHFSVEKGNKASSYSDGAGICDVNNVDCAKKMSSYPPLCFLDADGRNYGGSVPKNEIKGTDYCKAVVGSS